MIIAFIGLGNMGGGMAANLVKAGHGVRAFDLSAEALERARGNGCDVFSTVREAVQGVDAVVTMLPNGKIVESVYEGEVFGQAPAGALLLDCSTIDVGAARLVAADAVAAGYEMVDAPVSGGISRAESGTLSLMVGGLDEEAFELVRPVLEAMGERIFRTGPVGSGHAMKALNNFLGASAYTTGVEALAIGREFGLDPRVMLDVVNSSTGRSFNTEVVLKQDVITGRYGTGFALGLLAKDVGIAADLADAVGVDAPACQLVRRRWAEAATGLGFAADHSEAHKQWWPIDLVTEAPDADERG